MTDLSRDEFAALRATIRERGTARIWIVVFTLAAWGALTLAVALVGAAPIFVLVPLLVLAGGFEAIFSLHIGVERIGRYLQAMYEDRERVEAPRWETTAMRFGGGGVRVTATDPLFCAVFLIAAFLNLLPGLGSHPIAVELATIGGVHVVFGIRVLLARRAAAAQRDIDLARFRALRDHPPPSSSPQNL